MKDKGSLLLKTLLLSTSQLNIYKYSTDKKKKKRIVGNIIGVLILYVCIMAYCIMTCIGYGQIGIIDSAPVMCAIVIATIAFVFTLFKTNGYLFNFKEYDMLMSLPFEARTVAACKFLYMYVNSLPWYMSIAVAMAIGYGIYAKPAFYVYLIWIVLSLILPIIPMLLASFIGFLIARVSSGFRKTNIVQTVLIMIFVLLMFASRFFIEDMFRNDKVEETLSSLSEATEGAARIFLPAGWFSRAIVSTSIVDILLLIGVSILLFAVVFIIVGNSYRSINSALKSHAAAKKFKMSAQKKRSAAAAVAFKEWKRMTGSTNYMANAGIGMILSVIVGLLTLIIGFDKIVALVTQNAPFDSSILQPAIPFLIYFFTGMMATTACSPSLEGKNYWIVQSLPIEKTVLYRGKMLFNILLSVPPTVFAILCMCISAKVPLPDTLLYLILGIVLCAFSTAWGCVCGIKHIRLDWENEIEVIKQGAAVTIYLLPNMFVVMGLVVLVVFLGMQMDHKLLALIFILIVSALALLSYLRAMALAKKS